MTERTVAALDDLNRRINILRALLIKKEEYYHRVTIQGDPDQRGAALIDCVEIRAELMSLEQQRDRIKGDVTP